MIHPVRAALLTERLSLRKLTSADASNLLTLDGDPEVMRFLGPTKSLAEIAGEVLPRLLTCPARSAGLGYWAAESRADGAFAGWFGLRPVAPADTPIVSWPTADGLADAAELGYRLRHGAWGHGYATEGAKALVHRAFTEFGIDEIVATTMAVNVGSRRVMEKVGLRYARTVHLDWPDPLDGNEHGDVEYRLRRSDWTGR